MVSILFDIDGYSDQSPGFMGWSFGDFYWNDGIYSLLGEKPVS